MAKFRSRTKNFERTVIHSDKKSAANQLLSILAPIIGFETKGIWNFKRVTEKNSDKIAHKCVVNIKVNINIDRKLISSKNPIQVTAMGSEKERAKLFASFATLFKLFHKFGSGPFIEGYTRLVIEQNKQAENSQLEKKYTIRKNQFNDRLVHFKKRLETLKATKFK